MVNDHCVTAIARRAKEKRAAAPARKNAHLLRSATQEKLNVGFTVATLSAAAPIVIIGTSRI
jgi:hypothetical protein